MSQSRVTPISGFPEFLPGDRIVEQHFLDVIRETFELHGFASVETRAVEPIERLVQPGRGRRQGDLRDLTPGRAAPRTPAARAGSGCTST